MTAPSPSFSVLAAFTPAPGANPLTGIVLQVALIFAIFYFIVMRPQAKQRREHEASLKALKRGDEVVTEGGVVGEVVHIKEGTKDGTPTPTMDDRVTIKSGESRLVVVRGRISRVTTRTAESGPAA